MLKKLDKYTIFLLVLFVSAFSFYYWLRPEGMYYQEIFQMFIWDADYLSEVVLMPGGLASYIGEFLVQFYYYPLLGAIIIAGLITLSAWLTGKVAKALYPQAPYSILHALPALMLWYTIGNMDTIHGFMVAICMSEALAWILVAQINRNSASGLYIAIAGIGIGYFLIGPAVYSTLAILLIHIYRKRIKMAWGLAAVLSLALSMAICIRLVMYTVPQFIYGLEYFRFRCVESPVLITIAICALVHVVRLPESLVSGAKKTAVQAALCILALIPIYKAHPGYQYQIIKMLKMAHNQQWGDIVAEAERNTPYHQNSMAIVNMALAFEHKLTDQMFRFPQLDSEWLIPEVRTDLLNPLLTAEAWFWMGLNQMAMRQYFESKEGNPTYRGSTWDTKRLAECYMVEGEYAIATKHLLQLRKTLFYKKTADQYLELIRQGKADEHPMIAELKNNKIKNNGRQDTDCIDDLLEKLLRENPQNYLAFEYLMANKMLKTDLEGIARDLSLGSKVGLKEIPTHLQEALTYAWWKKYNSLDKLPQNISQDVRNRFSNNLITNDSYWKYLLSTLMTKNETSN